MIDHVLGRPSLKYRKVQVLAVVAFWLTYLVKGNPHGPPGIRNILQLVAGKGRFTTWRTIVSTILYLYVARNFSKLVDLESPEPLAGMYSKSFFRATYVFTALDAGYWTAMKIRNKYLRDFCSVLFSGYYLIAAEAADEKVRRVRACITIQHLRVSWNKGTTPTLKFLQKLLAGNKNKYAARHIRIQRPDESLYSEPIEAWLYFEGSAEELAQQTKLLLDFPGGGFVAMSPRHHEDKLMAWSRKLRIPVLSVDYKKAPEYPYPYALHECYDIYSAIINSNGKVIGFSGDVTPRIAMTGDSAGGSLAAGVCLMIIDAMFGIHTDSESARGRWGRGRRRSVSRRSLPLPEGIVLIYPCLDMNITSWMSDEQMALIRDRSHNTTIKNVTASGHQSSYPTSGLESPASEYEQYESGPVTPLPLPQRSPITPRPLLKPMTAIKSTPSESTLHLAAHRLLDTKPPATTSLAMTSRLSYTSDRILTPEMMRAMVLLYIGPNHRPDFARDYLLSPIVAPESHLARFPKCYFLTGERDPLVDDTVIFAGRISKAKAAAFSEEEEESTPDAGNGEGAYFASVHTAREFREKDWLEVKLLHGVSHGFFQMGSIYPEAWREMDRVAGWVEDVFGEKVERKKSKKGKVESGWKGTRNLMGRRMNRLTGGLILKEESEEE
ncbi:alpha/beta-hydrolase [Ascobolus immersus RN42]|uniref:Alpha/beta-hydrolase n=1 Tax=Ascobolus immersus RN42 TaxID=1160509 RepID=A0A3N4IPV9_ASCIM|nr:alpha/beta-hydrolase [Ascobolus immersus RN42]